MENNKFKKLKLRIAGLHCASCEVLVERNLKKVPGVQKVNVSHTSGKAEIICTTNPDINKLNEAVKNDGYSVSLWQDPVNDKIADASKNTATDYLYIVWIAMVILAVYSILKKLDFLPSFAISEHMSYSFIFLIGLFAAVSSCIAVTGGLLIAMAAKYNETHPGLTGIQKFKPHIYFNIGRVAGYTVFGALVGGLGSVLALSAKMNGYLIILVSLVMLSLGFQLLHLFPGLRKFTPKMPKFLGHRIHGLAAKDNKGGPFTLGALTFFLPCGFTQALQLYVLASGDWKIGALTMFAFSLGTLPALVSLSAISSFLKGAFQKYFLKFAGVLIIILAVFNINNGLALAGINLDLNPLSAKSNSAQGESNLAPIVDGKQIVKMSVNGYSYLPNKFTVIEGVPVEWQIDGAGAAGCGRIIVMPTLGISKYLAPQGVTIITFTPDKTGTIPFNCSMGMMTRGSQFTVIPNTKGIAGAKIEQEADTAAPACDPTIASCLETQKLKMEVSRSKGVVPRSLSAKKGVPVDLTIDDKDPLGGCMSVWVIPEYNVTIQMNGGIKKAYFTPTKIGPIYLTCSMGSKLAEINITD